MDNKGTWDELQENDKLETGFEERHEARRYRQIHPYVNQMGGWANFSSWMVTHARSYFQSYELLQKENADLRKRLDDIDSEFKCDCSTCEKHRGGPSDEEKK